MQRNILSTRLIRTGVLFSLFAFAFSPFGECQSGSASPGVLARPSPAVQTNLPPIVVDFKDIAEEAGLLGINVTGGADKKDYILETTGNGVAIFDYDNDGLMDIFVVNATTMDGKGAGATSTSHLYHTLGNLDFEDVPAKP